MRSGWAWAAEMRRDRDYRRLAEGYRLPDGSRRIYCYHVRKTGGTSLHRSFMALGGEDPAEVHHRVASSRGNRAVSNGLTFVAHTGELLTRGHYFYGWSHIPAHELRLPEHTFTVSVLRDPVARVCSHYQMLLHGTVGTYPFQHSPEEGSLVGRGFADFLASMPREELLRQLYMFSKTFDVDEAVEFLQGCGHVFTTERYETGLGELANRLELPLTMRRERVSAKQVEIPGEDRERLRALLEPEYEMMARLSVATVI